MQQRPTLEKSARTFRNPPFCRHGADVGEL